jgi:hypothetical protein
MTTNPNHSRKYARVLTLLLGLFVFRVIAQFLVLKFDVPLLPSFDAWHSALLPYPLLVATQLAIIALCGSLCIRMYRNAISPHRKLGKALLILGSLYIAVMVLRLTLGFTLLATHSWFSHYLPTFFHFVLAGFVLVLGHFHFTKARGMYASHS